MDIITLFCDIDDFLMLFEQWMQTRALPPPAGEKKRKCKQRMHTSEVMTMQDFQDYSFFSRDGF